MSEILVRTDGGRWLEPVKRGFSYEADLQDILVEHPQLFLGVGTGGCQPGISVGRRAS